MSKLERTSHGLLIVVALAALGLLARQEFFPKSSSLSTSLKADILGHRLTVPGLSLPKGTDFAVVAAVRSDCPFCAQSLPLYREVDHTRRSSHAPVSLFFVSSEPVDGLRAFLKSADISPDGVASLKLSELGISATPTLAIVDSEGLVKRAYYGKLSEQEGQDLLAFAQTGALQAR